MARGTHRARARTAGRVAHRLYRAADRPVFPRGRRADRKTFAPIRAHLGGRAGAALSGRAVRCAARLCRGGLRPGIARRSGRRFRLEAPDLGRRVRLRDTGGGSRREAPMPGVLDGVRVLDFGRYIAGPFCGALLGDLGAEVIRIEKLEGSEDRWVTPVAEGGEGAMFLQMGRNKLGMTLNPVKPAGREVVQKLVAVSDVVIANLPYDDLKKMGIDYETISAINPRIILATNSTFGSEGPYATRVGFDTIGQAMSGAMFLSGDGEVPTRANAPYVDFGTALLNTVGVLAALMDRAKTGKGQKVETALLRTAINT